MQNLLPALIAGTLHCEPHTFLNVGALKHLVSMAMVLCGSVTGASFFSTFQGTGSVEKHSKRTTFLLILALIAVSGLLALLITLNVQHFVQFKQTAYILTLTEMLITASNIILISWLGVFMLYRRRKHGSLTIVGALALALIHFNLYCWIGTQLGLDLFRENSFFSSSTVLFAVIACVIWLKTLPFSTMNHQGFSHWVSRISLLLGFLLFMFTCGATVLIHAIVHALPFDGLPLEQMFLTGSIISSLFAAGIAMSGLHLSRQYSGLFTQAEQQRLLMDKHSLLRNALDTIPQASTEAEWSQIVLKTAMGILSISSGALVSFEYTQWGNCLTQIAPHDLQLEHSTLPEWLTEKVMEYTNFPIPFQKGNLEGVVYPIYQGRQALAALFLLSEKPVHVAYNEQNLLRTLCQQAALGFTKVRLQTEKSKVEERFIKQLGLTKRLAENLGLGILAAKNNGQLLFINPQAEKLLGWHRQELRQPLLLSQIHPDVTANLSLLHEESQESTFIRKDGQPLSVFYAAAPIWFEAETQGLLYVFHDLSRQKKNELVLQQTAKKLVQSNQALEQYASLASHDLKAPLIKIQRFSQLLEKHPSLDHDARDMAQRLQKSALQMQGMVQDILKLSQISTAPQRFQLLDLEQLTRNVLEDLEDKIQSTQTIISIGRMFKLEGDAALLQLLIRNLLDNALKFRDKSRPLHIHLECRTLPENLCELRVSDNGIGFKAEQTEQIFKMFERLHGVHQYQGNGLGLALCKKVIERHNGSIRAESEPNSGATFIITLPITQETDT